MSTDAYDCSNKTKLHTHKIAYIPCDQHNHIILCTMHT